MSEEQLEELRKIRGVGPATASKLFEAGYRSIQDVARASPEALINLGIRSDLVSAILESARELAGIQAASISKPIPILERISGKETGFSLDLEGVSISLGEYKFMLTGSIKFSIKALEQL